LYDWLLLLPSLQKGVDAFFLGGGGIWGMAKNFINQHFALIDPV